MQRLVAIVLTILVITAASLGCAPKPIGTLDELATAGLKQQRWPLRPLSARQVRELRECDIMALIGERYADTSLDERLQAFTPLSACDWAVFVYSIRLGEEAMTLGAYELGALNQLVKRNYGFLLSPVLFYTYYYSKLDLVASPALANQAITTLRIAYDSDDMVDIGRFGTTAFTLVITNADTAPVVALEYSNPMTMADSANLEISVEQVQAIAPALRNLVPIGHTAKIDRCWDHYPNWSLEITFQGGKTLQLDTLNSTFDLRGGPFQTTLDGQSYLVYSKALTDQVFAITRAMGLSHGEPIAMGCGGYAGGAENLYPLTDEELTPNPYQ